MTTEQLRQKIQDTIDLYNLTNKIEVQKVEYDKKSNKLVIIVE